LPRPSEALGIKQILRCFNDLVYSKLFWDSTFLRGDWKWLWESWQMKHYWKHKKGICFKCRADAEPGPNMFLTLYIRQKSFLFLKWSRETWYGSNRNIWQRFFSGCSWKYIAWVVQSPLYKSWNVSQYWLFISGIFTPQGRGPYTESCQQFYVLGDVPTEVHSVRRL
jgi:hypothetical protein